MPRIIVALYDRLEDARDAVDALIENGFTHADISLVASDAHGEYVKSLNSQVDRPEDAGLKGESAAAGAGVGALVGGLGGLLAGLGALAIPGIGPVLAAGPIMAALAGAGIGAAAGGLLGALVELGIPRDQAELYAEGVRQGGTLVTVQTADGMVDETTAILNRLNPIDVDRHADAQRLEQETHRDGTVSSGEQPMNLEAESGTPLEEVRREMGIETSQEDTGDEAGVQPGLHRLGEGGAVIGIEKAGQTAYPPDEHDGTISMQDADQESRRAERGDTLGSGSAAGYSEAAPAGDLENPNRLSGYSSTAGFDAYELLYQQHYGASYSHMGRSYEELRPAYAFGYGLAHDPRFQDRDWQEVEESARNEWELSHTDQPWEDYKDAVREAWEAVTGWD